MNLIPLVVKNRERAKKDSEGKWKQRVLPAERWTNRETENGAHRQLSYLTTTTSRRSHKDTDTAAKIHQRCLLY